MINISSRESDYMRYTLSFIWIATGIISLGIYPQEQSFLLLSKVGLINETAKYALYSSAMMDMILGLLTLIKPSKYLWQFQAGLIIIYSGIIAVFLPEFLIHPFAPILKNLPILLLLWMLYKREVQT